MKRSTLTIFYCLLTICAPAFGVGTFDYDEATNTIKVTDGTEVAPATIEEIIERLKRIWAYP
ncbi:MAG TPA: hypothetical protein VMX36_13155 [Sedimentisphaerales bacterium]|nr:hypothetical protein [Sedimentisphaerales bacterium]